MPLAKGSSKEAIKTEMAAKPQKQAVAIAMRTAGKPKPKKNSLRSMMHNDDY